MSTSKRKSFYERPFIPETDSQKKLYQNIEKTIYAQTGLSRSVLDFKPIDDEMLYWISRLGDVVSVEYNNFISNETHISGWIKAKNRHYSLKISRSKKFRIKTAHILNKAKLVANYFVDNPENLPFVSFKDIDKQVLEADNLHWTVTNHYPELNKEFTQESNQLMHTSHSITVHPESIKLINERNFTAGFSSLFVRLANVYIPKEIFSYLQDNRIAPKNAIISALYYLCRFSFSVIAVELETKGEVFIGVLPSMEATFMDCVLRFRQELPWINENILEEGHSAFTVNHLSLSKSKSEAYETASYFMGRYDQLGWRVVNADFMHDRFRRKMIIELTTHDKKKIEKHLLEKHGKKITTEKYLQSVLKKLLDT